MAEDIYYESLSKFVKKKRLNKIGGNKERCAVDETAVGRVGRMVGKPASKRGSYIRAADRIATRRPCKTIWKPKTKAFPKSKAGSSKDKRSNKSTQWLWLAVQTGKDGQQPRSHKVGNKRVAMDVLPDAIYIYIGIYWYIYIVDGTPAQHQSQKPCFTFTTPMAQMPATARPLTSRDTGDRTAEMVSAMTHRWLLVEATGN